MKDFSNVSGRLCLLKSPLLLQVSMDFFTVPTLTGRVPFVLVLLTHHRRRIVHLAVTEHPTAAWTAQQVIEAFPNETAPRWLLRDRDAIYGDVFRRRVAQSWPSRMSSPVHQVLGKIRMPRDWSDPFGASVWTT